MSGIIRKQLVLLFILLSLGFLLVQKANAAALSNVSDTVTTSRPSAAAPISAAADQAANATQVSVIDNGSIYLSSDSATLQADTGQTQNIVNVASMSAQISGSPNTRNIYFTSAITNSHHKGTAVIVPITATHTIKFTTTSNVPNGGKIIITFPGAGSNIASPSATGFSFNGMTTSNPTDVVCFPTSACAGGISVTGSNTITLTTNAAQSGATTIFVLVGCTVQSSGTCTTFAPRLINPTKTAAAGTADNWKITVQTADASSIVLDSSKVIVGTIEAVQVQATVEPSLTFTIAGVTNGSSACSDTTNEGTGLDSTATFVNLGGLTNAQTNISAQTLTVNTNGASGYTITATSSGRFINPATGFYIPDANTGNGLTASSPSLAPVPGAIAAGTADFGIHPCSAGSTSIPTVNAEWGSGTTASGNAKYANPWNTGTNGFYAIISNFAAPATNSTTTVEYAATVSSTTPAGTYTTVFTYVATPTF